ncbi:hypothetical protein HMPREF2976_11335 [Corynebacterium sp. HMSC077D10]|nr:hypothetical protein HMPREF2748_06355 [Corynebacterium sp. HMSC077B05]OFP19988.1 hypothetical protein HMPREF2998_08075 [Corynebacterium sp. HMSC065A05]OFP66414.1 hypothetical protein HMPREF2976_11335 [Corynebacterium sp. HMSC077D10]
MSTLAPVAASAQSFDMTQQERDQWRTDPLGAVLWTGIKSSSNALRGDPVAMSVASVYSMGSPSDTYPGAFGKVDQCAKFLTSSSPLGGVRFTAAGLCIMANPSLRAELAEQPGIPLF